MGHRFSVSTGVDVKSLVFMGWSGVSGISGTDGDAVTVRLWNADTGAELASHAFTNDAVNTAGATPVTYTHGTYVGIRYEFSISPLTLTPGVNYMISSDTYAGGIQHIREDNGTASTQTVASEITFGGEFFGGAGTTIPNSADGTVLKYGGPSFTYDVVPEPSAALLGSLGVLALLRRRRAR